MTRRLFALGAMLLLTAAAPPDDRGRPVILLVHGRGMVDRDSAAMRKLWLAALSSGLETVTRDSVVADRDVRVVWYADVLDPRSNAGCDYDRGDVRAHRDATQDPDLKSFASLAGNLIGSLSIWLADTEMTAQLRGLASDAAFLGDARKRCASERRLADAIHRARREGGDHSRCAQPGLARRDDSFVFSRRQCSRQSLRDDRIMLGSPELRRLLIGGDSTDVLSKPASAKEWINIFNEQDPIAGPVSLGHDVPANPPRTSPTRTRWSAISAGQSWRRKYSVVGAPRFRARIVRSVAGSWSRNSIRAVPCTLDNFHPCRRRSGRQSHRGSAEPRRSGSHPRVFIGFEHDLSYGTVEGFGYAAIDQRRSIRLNGERACLATADDWRRT